MLAVAVEFGVRTVNFLEESLSLFPLEHAPIYHRLVFRSRAHAHRMRHFVHGSPYEHVAAFFAKTQIAVAARLSGWNTWRIINIDVLGEIRVFIINIDSGIHDRSDSLVSIQFVIGRVRGLVERIRNTALGKAIGQWHQDHRRCGH